MFKNVASQKLTVYAFDATTNLPKTGDAGNLTAYVSKDDGTLTVLADTSATEVDATNGKGYYIFDLAQAETNADKLLFSCKSSTSNIVVLCVPSVVYTVPASFTSFVTPGVAQTGDNFARLGAPAGASVSADVAATKALLPTALVGGRMDASVGAMAANVLTATAIATDAITAGKIAADAIGASELAADAVAEIADQVWDEVLSGHLTGGTTGAGLNAAGSAGDPWSTAIPGAYGAGSAGKILGDNLNATVSSRASQTSVDTVDDFLDTEIAAIKAKTDNLPTDPADQSAVEAAITAAALTAAGVRTAVGLASANLDTQLSTIDDFLDTEIAAIKAKTDLIPAAPAAVGDIPTAAQNAAGVLDLAAGVETGLTLRQAMRLIAAAAAGKLSGAATTTVVIRNAVADGKDRITATVDADGNRSAVTVDLT